MGFNIFLFLWFITNYLLPIFGIRSLVLRSKFQNVLSLAPSTQGITLLNQSIPLTSGAPNDCDRHPGTPYSAELLGWYFSGSCLKCATSSHAHLGLGTRTVSLFFPTEFFLSYLSDADLNKLYSCLLIEKYPGVWRLHYKYSDWSTFINDATFRLASLVLSGIIQNVVHKTEGRGLQLSVKMYHNIH